MLILMSVLVGIMNVINYSIVVNDADSTVDLLFRMNDQTPPKDQPSGGNPDLPELPGGADQSGTNRSGADQSGTNQADNANQDDDASGAGQSDAEKPGTSGGPHGMSPEVPYEARFFTVTLNESGEVVKTDFSKILTVDSSTVDEYVKKALDSGNEKGFIEQFRFSKRRIGQETTILFLDCGRKIDSFRAFLWTSVAVGFGGCVIIFVVFLLFSGKIIEPIAESYEKQKRFISDAGHEMKTPLTIINANLDLVEDDESENEELNEIRVQTKRLSELTNNLVYLSKMEETEHRITKIEMPLSDTVSETISSFRALAAGKELKFNVRVQPCVTICASPDEIRHLASILLENAIKYADRGGTVEVALSANKKSAIFSVGNTTATPVNKEDVVHVFERFYRTDGSRNSETGGHGIGLSIAKAIAGAHGGTIKAETKTGNDFCVTAVLPLK